jgi:hypothetical protein
VLVRWAENAGERLIPGKLRLFLEKSGDLVGEIGRERRRSGTRRQFLGMGGYQLGGVLRLELLPRVRL